MTDEVTVLRNGRKVDKAPAVVRQRSPKRPDVKKLAGALQTAFKVEHKPDPPMEFTEKIDPVHLASFKTEPSQHTSRPILPEGRRYNRTWYDWAVFGLGCCLLVLYLYSLYLSAMPSLNQWLISMNRQGSLKLIEINPPPDQQFQNWLH